jgi:hypothetical protein
VSPPTPTDSFLHNHTDPVGQPQAEQGPHRGDAITRCDALAFPDSTQAIECVSLAMVFTIDLCEELVYWRIAEGKRAEHLKNVFSLHFLKIYF